MSGIGSSLLKKMGWKEGTGIGKSGTGIIEPIKPKLKLGTEGIGFKESEQLCSGWWMEAFNKAAGAAAADPVQPEPSVAPVLGRPYSSAFSAASVLRDGREEPSSSSKLSSAELLKKSPPRLPRTPSDAELLAACGGRTAHCAARFGLNLSGKLARVRAQDSAGAGCSSTAQVESDEASTASDSEAEKKKKKEKRKNKEKKRKCSADDSPAEEEQPATERKKKKHKRTRTDIKKTE